MKTDLLNNKNIKNILEDIIMKNTKVRVEIEGLGKDNFLIAIYKVIDTTHFSHSPKYFSECATICIDDILKGVNIIDKMIKSSQLSKSIFEFISPDELLKLILTRIKVAINTKIIADEFTCEQIENLKEVLKDI